MRTAVDDPWPVNKSSQDALSSQDIESISGQDQVPIYSSQCHHIATVLSNLSARPTIKVTNSFPFLLNFNETELFNLEWKRKLNQVSYSRCATLPPPSTDAVTWWLYVTLIWSLWVGHTSVVGRRRCAWTKVLSWVPTECLLIFVVSELQL